MHDDDVYRQVADLHVACIDQGFLSTLGPAFVALMYRAIDESGDGVLIVERSGGRVVGFIAGGSSMRLVYRRMLHAGPRLALALAPSLWRPARLRRMLEIVRYGGGGKLDADIPAQELWSMAVDPDHRGTDCAEKLFRRFAEQLRARRVDAFRIVAGNDLARAHRFYRKMGAVPRTSLELHAGSASTVFVCRTRGGGASSERQVHEPDVEV